MSLGYDGKLYILAFDHRGSFQKKMFGIEGDPTPEETETIADAKHLIFEGMLKAAERGVEPSATGTLVDEQFGGDIPAQAKAKGLKLAMPVEKSGQNEFDFQYGDEFGAAHPRLRPRLLEGPRALQPRRRRRDERAPERAAQAAGRLAPRERPQVPLRAARARGGRTSSSRSAATPTATTPSCAPTSCAARSRRSRTTASRWTSGRSRASTPARTARCSPRTSRRDGRDGVVCVLLGRGASDEKVDHWLRQAAPVDGFVGLRDRPLDLVGRAEGLPRRIARARGRRGPDRRQLPALRGGLRERRAGRDRLSRQLSA